MTRAAGGRLRAGLDAASPHVGQVRGRRMLQALELVADRDSLEPLAGAAVRLGGSTQQRGLMI